MSPDPSAPLAFPPALQARLNAAGVTDDASLQAALENDPSLRADFDAFFQQNPELLAAMQMNALLQAFAAVRDTAQMMAFWHGVPTELEEPFMQVVEQVIAQAQAVGDADMVNHLTPRLEGFRQICEEAAQEAEQTPPTVLALGAFFQAADDAAAAAVFEAQRALLQPYEAQQMMDALAAQPPEDTDAETRQRIIARRDLLRRLRGAAPTVDLLAGSPPLADAHGSDDSPLAPRPSHVYGDLYQAQEQHFQSAIADRGGVATVVNNIFVQSIERRWSRPTPPALRRDAVARPHEMAQIKAALAARGGVAITGEAVAPTSAIRRTPSLAVQGMAGVGKTVLAYLLAQELDAVYADGVIWEPLGPDFTAPAQAQAVLRRWAGYATNFFALDDNAQRAFTFEPAAVRTLLAEHPHLLVVLDNVWSLDAIKPLQAALPPGVHLVITTRSAEIARGLGAGRVEIGRLSDDEAAALVTLRLGWQPQRDAPADAWVFALIEGIGGHALGLDVALGVLQREGGADRGEWQVAAQRLLAAIRRGDLGDLTLGDALDHNVQAVLLYSVRTLDAETQRRFRRSGALAPDALFTTDDMAAVWGCDADSARRTLVAFANAALVERAAEGSGRWRQHALLRGLALALLRAAGEEETAAHAHARAYAAAMRAADDAQRYHELLPAMPQLRHAMQWAQANDLETALDIAAACLNLQIQFGLVRESANWASQLVVALQQRMADSRVAWRVYLHQGSVFYSMAALPGEDRRKRLDESLAAYDESLNVSSPISSPEIYANSQIGRGNILSDLATLPGEDRRGRLYEALAAYDDALRYRRPENAPLDYAQTQNNRANRLSELATLPGEDRRGRLYEALAAYDDALRYLRPENAPLDYAQTQNNRANILSDLATLPGEDRRGRLYEALHCAVEAVSLFEQFQQAQYLEIGRRVLRSLRAACGGDFPALWAELGLGEPPDWLTEESDGDAPGPALPADLQARLAAAGVTDEASLQAALEADPSLRADFEAFFQQNPQLVAAMQMNALLQAFAAVNNTEEMIAFWRSVPTELEEPFVQAVAQLIDQAGAAGEAETVKVLRSRLEGFQEMRAGAARTLARQEPLLAHLEHYQALLQAADAEQPQVEPWRGVTQAGEALLALQPGAEHLLNWDALRRQLASAYNILGNALDNTGDKAAALAAFERASELQPDFAMWRRNQTGMLIELGRLDAARAALAAARALEPDAPRLAELEAALAAAEGIDRG